MLSQSNHYRLQRLDEEGRVKTVRLPKDHASHDDIVTAVCGGFQADTRFSDIVSGWHLLRVVLQGTGRPCCLSPMEGGSMKDVTFDVWEK